MKKHYIDILTIIAFLCFITLTISNNTKIRHLNSKLNEFKTASLQQDSSLISNDIMILNNIIKNDNVYVENDNYIKDMLTLTNVRIEEYDKCIKNNYNLINENTESVFMLLKFYWSEHDSLPENYLEYLREKSLN